MNNEKYPQRIDYGIILSVMLLALISMLALYSTTVLIEGGGMRATIMQGAWFFMGAIAVGVIMYFDSEQLWKLTYILYFIGVLLLIYTVIFYDRDMARRASGVRRWVNVPIVNMTVQPSEFVKIPYILMLSKIVTKHNSRYLDRTYSSDGILLAKVALVAGIPIIAVSLQNDLGTTLVYVAIAVGIVLLSGIKWQILLPIFLIIGIVGFGSVYLVATDPELFQSISGLGDHQIDRITTWLNPYDDPMGIGYQITLGFRAIGSGGVFGKGFGVTEVPNIPVRESDMIFTTIAENFGFAGGAFLIFVYFVLVYHMVKVVYDTKNEFYAYIATGVIMMFVFHVFENIGMTIGLMPMTGIPLPLVSQGGSSILGNMMGIGLIMSMRFHHKSYFFSGDGEEFHEGS